MYVYAHIYCLHIISFLKHLLSVGGSTKLTE